MLLSVGWEEVYFTVVVGTEKEVNLSVSMGGEALGPVKALCPSVGECQGQEAGVGRLVSRGREEGVGGFQRGNQERG